MKKATNRTILILSLISTAALSSCYVPPPPGRVAVVAPAPVVRPVVRPVAVRPVARPVVRVAARPVVRRSFWRR